VPREELVAVQTPQAFLGQVLREALAGDLTGATDCAALVEARGGRVTTVLGDPKLLKVTDAEDLELVAGWL
jgi:2-C-methyl-D-erythritol 4-phosphate cytidylyltransferase